MEINNKVEIQEPLKSKLRYLIQDYDVFDMEAISERRHWMVGVSADVNMFDEFAERVALAMQNSGCKKYLAIATGDIREFPSKMEAYVFDATKEGVERFQHPDYFDLNLNDCLLFDEDLQFLILKTDTIKFVLFVGTLEFVATAVEEVGDALEKYVEKQIKLRGLA